MHKLNNKSYLYVLSLLIHILLSYVSLSYADGSTLREMSMISNSSSLGQNTKRVKVKVVIIFKQIHIFKRGFLAWCNRASTRGDVC